MVALLRILPCGAIHLKAVADPDGHGGRHFEFHVHSELLHSDYGLDLHHSVSRHQPSQVRRTCSHSQNSVRRHHWLIWLWRHGGQSAILLHPVDLSCVLRQHHPHELLDCHFVNHLWEHEAVWYIQIQSQPLSVLRAIYDCLLRTKLRRNSAAPSSSQLPQYYDGTIPCKQESYVAS